MKIRFRSKALDDIDPAIICCDGLRASIREREGLAWEFSEGRMNRERVRCIHCGDCPMVVTLTDPANGKWIIARLVDIDEGCSVL